MDLDSLFEKYKGMWFKTLPFVQVKTLRLKDYCKKRREIQELLERGRKLKSCNIWSDDFDEAVQGCFLPALAKCISLKEDLNKSMETSHDRKERITLVIIAGVVLNIIIYGAKFIFTLF
ncbi:MAG TPA: hypothetical protein PK587_06600 [Syntrophales bacterium]|nr:hypothetical protein [Syntrophales bacterium]